MAATLIDGKKIASEIKDEVRVDTAKFIAARGTTPGLAFILVGDNSSSLVYVTSKGKACAEMGFHSVTERLPGTVSQDALLARIAQFNDDPKIHGILVQLPLPEHIDEHAVLEAVNYRKDVDGFHPVNVGRMVLGLPCLKACTPLGIQELLLRSGNDPAGKHVVVVGRSNIVGKPVANILLQKLRGANAAVTVVHTGVRDLPRLVREGDIVIAAIGRPGHITGDMLRPGCVVIDVGINRIEDRTRPNGTRIVGDVDFATASLVAGAITPVPGGVGPMTIAMLMKNTLTAAQGTLYG